MRRLRRLVLPVALTVAGLWGSAGLASANEEVPPVSGVGSCSNTECQGTAGCRYWVGTSCSFASSSSCTNTQC